MCVDVTLQCNVVDGEGGSFHFPSAHTIGYHNKEGLANAKEAYEKGIAALAPGAGK